MPNVKSAIDEQTALWNGAGGRAWVELSDVLDRILEPFANLLVDTLTAETNRRVLDVGCGTGATTVATARRLAGKGSAIGVDISEQMITAARARAERESSRATFWLGNAQTYPFEPGSFDTILSRFGVMFFEDPIVAFENLRRAIERGGTLRFIAWRGAAENPFMTTAERAGAHLLPNLQARPPCGPGQFSFADRDRLQRILGASGWAQLEIEPLDVTCTMAETDLVPYLTLGPVGRALGEVDDATRARVVEAIRPAFEEYVHGQEVRFLTATWMVAARG